MLIDVEDVHDRTFVQSLFNLYYSIGNIVEKAYLLRLLKRILIYLAFLDMQPRQLIALAEARSLYCLVAQLHVVNDVAEIGEVAARIAKIELVSNLQFLPSNAFLRFLHHFVLVRTI